jgi:UDP-N-acetylglucosamine:LPS N-acetylglucosamine transferase
LVERSTSEGCHDDSVYHAPQALRTDNFGANGDDGAQQPRRQRLLLVASAGGHWIELCRLSQAFANHDCMFVSTAAGMTAPVGSRRVEVIADSSRDTIATMVRTASEIRTVIRRFDPDMVITTGAAPGALALVLARLHGARTVWIDSIANSDELSLSGRMVRLFAELRLTQWEHLSKPRGPHFYGRVM